MQSLSYGCAAEFIAAGFRFVKLTGPRPSEQYPAADLAWSRP
jgi:hypothetical protein